MVAGKTYDGQAHIFPLFPLGRACLPDWRALLSGGRIVYPVSEQNLNIFPEAEFVRTWSDSDSDYLYVTEEMAVLSGRDRRTKRTQARRFEDRWTPHVSDIDDNNTADALSVLDQWQADVRKPWADTDYRACEEGLQFRRDLNLQGIIIYAEDRPVGFLLASRTAADGLAVHFAKGGRAYAGVFPFMFRTFAERMRHTSGILNFEQDLGNPGFRQSKRAFGPMGQLRKYRIALKPEERTE